MDSPAQDSALPPSAPTDAAEAAKLAKAIRGNMEDRAQSRAGDKETRKARGIFTGATKPTK